MGGVRWCMFGRGHCVLGRGGLRGRIVFEALSAWEGKKGMCGQRMPCVAMGGRRMPCMVCTHGELGMRRCLRCGTRSATGACGGRPLGLSCRCPLRWSSGRMSRARRSLCNMHTCKLSQSVCTLPLQLSLVRRWRPGSTRRIRRAWGWVQGARVRQGMACHGSLCNSLCTVHVRMMGLHVHTLSLWGVPGRRRRRA